MPFSYYRCMFLAALLTAYLGAGHAGADTISNWNGGAGNWSTAGQWTPPVIPNNIGGHSYDVTIPSSGSVTLDYNPAINTFTLNGSLYTGTVPLSQGPGLTTLRVNGDMNLNGSIVPVVEPQGRAWLDSLVVGGNLNNRGSAVLGGRLSLGGNLNNMVSLALFSNQGFYPFPFQNNSALTIGGQLLNSGTLDIYNSVSNIAGSIANSGTLNIASVDYTSPTVTVSGSVSNSGSLNVSPLSHLGISQGTSSLIVKGTLTNQVSGTLTVDNPSSASPNATPGTLIAQSLINYGTTYLGSSTTSSVQQFTNYGTVYVQPCTSCAAGGQLDVGTLKTVNGSVDAINSALIVGSGTIPPGFVGYEQFANGILDYSGGGVDIESAPAILNGTLDIVLGQGYQPVGTMYVVLADSQSTISGTFSNVEGLVFDGGRERYLLSYDTIAGPAVTLTVEENVTPEPASVMLLFLGAGGALAAAHKLRG